MAFEKEKNAQRKRKEYTHRRHTKVVYRNRNAQGCIAFDSEKKDKGYPCMQSLSLPPVLSSSLY